MVDFGKKLKALRKARAMTQLQLAKSVGVTKSVISAYESSSRYPSYDVLIRIAVLFHVSTDYLLGISRERTIDVSGLSEEEIGAVSRMVELLKPR